jgi:hypothetical protein
MVSARASCVSLLNGMLSFLGCCPFERPLGRAAVKALLERRGCVPLEGTNEGEAERLRVVEIAQRYDLDRPYNGAARTGVVLEEFERQRALWLATLRR